MRRWKGIILLERRLRMHINKGGPSENIFNRKAYGIKYIKLE
jgi:hypothetical protein